MICKTVAMQAGNERDHAGWKRRPKAVLSVNDGLFLWRRATRQPGRGFGRFRAGAWLFALPVLFAAAMSWAQFGETSIEHLPVATAEPGQPILIRARILNQPAEVRFVRVYYRPVNAASFAYVEMYKEVEEYTAEIPGEEVTAPGIEYFILAAFENGDLVTEPRYDAHRSPHAVQVAPVRAGGPQAVPPTTTGGFPGLILSPEAGERLKAEEVMLAISFTVPDSVDSASVQLSVDGRDVTSEADISRFVVTWTPVAPPSPGRHFVTLRAQSLSGESYPPLEFSFDVLGVGQRAEPVLKNFHGQVFAETRQERIARRNYVNNILGGRMSGSAGPVDFFANAYITSLEKPREQPRNRFSVGVNVGPLGLRLGDVYPRYTELTLWGQRVRGVSGFVHLGFVNLDFTMGEMVRAVEGVASVKPVGAPLSGSFRIVNGDTILIRQMGTYRRRVWAIRPSFGSARRLQVGLTFLKALDDTNSVVYGLKPKDNLVLGPDFVLSLARGRFRLEGSAAFSLVTEDISGGSITKDEVDSVFNKSIPIDPAKFDKFIILNENTVPLDPSAGNSVAYQLKMTLSFWRNNLRAGYRHLGPQYQTLANPFLRTNLRGFFFDDRIRLLRNMLYLNIGYEDYDDSFSEADELPTVDLRTFSYGFSVYPNPGLPQITFQMRNHGRNNGLVDTTLVSGGYDPRIDNSTRDAVLTFSQQFQVLERDQNLSYTLSRSLRDDRFGSPLADIENTMHLLNWRGQLTRDLSGIINFAHTKNHSGGGQYLNDFRYQLLSGGVQWSFLRGLGLLRLEARHTIAKSEMLHETVSQKTNVRRFGLITGGEVRWGRHAGFLDAAWTAVRDKITDDSYQDYILRLRYQFRW